MKEAGDMEHWRDKVLWEEEWGMGMQHTVKKHITGPLSVLEDQQLYGNQPLYGGPE